MNVPFHFQPCVRDSLFLFFAVSSSTGLPASRQPNDLHKALSSPWALGDRGRRRGRGRGRGGGRGCPPWDRRHCIFPTAFGQGLNGSRFVAAELWYEEPRNEARQDREILERNEGMNYGVQDFTRETSKAVTEEGKSWLQTVQIRINAPIAVEKALNNKLKQRHH